MKKMFLLLTVGALVACPVISNAQDAANTPPPPPEGGPGGHHHHDPMAGLTDAEKAELKKAHDAAIAADPSLATEEAALKASHDAGTPPTEEEHQKMHAFREKMDAAMIKADNAVAPIIEKMKKHHKGPGGPDAPPAPADA